MSAHCTSCVSCEVEGCEATAFCLDDRPDSYPCAHDRALCADHNVEECIDCRLEAEGQMADSGEYDARKDPLFRGDPGPDHLDVGEWLAEVDARAAERDFDPVTNGKRRRA